MGILGGLNGGCQDDVSRLPDGLGEKLVVLRIGGLGKDDVEDDEPGPGRRELADDLSMETAGPGPGLAQILKRLLVNGDDDELRGGRGLGPQTVTEVQTMIFQRLPYPQRTQGRQAGKDHQGEAENPHPGRPQHFRNKGQV